MWRGSRTRQGRCARRRAAALPAACSRRSRTPWVARPGDRGRAYVQLVGPLVPLALFVLARQRRTGPWRHHGEPPPFIVASHATEAALSGGERRARPRREGTTAPHWP